MSVRTNVEIEQEYREIWGGGYCRAEMESQARSISRDISDKHEDIRVLECHLRVTRELLAAAKS